MIEKYEKVLSKLPSNEKDSKITLCRGLGCMYHLASLAARQEGDEQRAQACLGKASANFEQAVKASGVVKAGLYTTYGNFLLAIGKTAQAYDYLHQAIASGDDEDALYFGSLEKAIVTPILQEKIEPDKEIQFRGLDYAYYLMIHHYADFQKAGIAMAQTRKAYLVAYQASLDQRSGQRRQEQADKIAYYLLGSLYKAQENQEAAATAFARS